MSANLSHIHRFIPGGAPDAPTLLLLHGTGADENDLIPLARRVSPEASLLSPRGQVKEGMANRWFRRMAEGVFDEQDLGARADALAEFVEQARQSYALPAPPIALGFSNGANIAAGLLWRRPEALAGAVLLRAMVPFRSATPPMLAGKRVLLLSGRNDPFAPAASRDALAMRLVEAGATLDHRITGEAHGLTEADLAAAQGWLATR
jgi:phospholipase/carboxylesterase